MIISIANQKGGSGKTTTAVNVAAGLLAAGKKVLLVDFDPQANATVSLGIKLKEGAATIYESLQKPSKIKEAIIDRGGLHVLPATIDLSAAEVELTREMAGEAALKRALKSIRDEYDYILIDCPPSLSLLTLNALTVSDGVWVPVQTAYLAMQGIGKLTRTLDDVQERLNEKIRLDGVIITLFDSRRTLDNAVVGEVSKQFKDKMFKTAIRQNVALAEAPSHGKTIFEYDPNSNGTADYTELVKDIIRRRR